MNPKYNFAMIIAWILGVIFNMTAVVFWVMINYTGPDVRGGCEGFNDNYGRLLSSPFL
jgi:hypothetical protein